MEIIRSKEISGLMAERLVVGCVQMAPIWLNRAATLAKVAQELERAAAEGCQLVTFGEALVPGYPFWLEHTDGARFNNPKQKAIYARYVDEGVDISRGDLNQIVELAKKLGVCIYLGIMERAPDRGGHTLYCSLVFISSSGKIESVHRKLQPTYEERLAWGQGDGHGLVVHQVGPFRAGGLNCFENWMPLSRAALYAQGESLHVSVWPGGLHNTYDLPSFIAKESRSYVIAVSALMRPGDFPDDMRHLEEMLATGKDFFANGGTAICGPDGEFIIEPVVGREALIIAELDHALVRGERQNFDLAGHYSRPDVTKLIVNRQRQSTVEFIDQPQRQKHG